MLHNYRSIFYRYSWLFTNKGQPILRKQQVAKSYIREEDSKTTRLRTHIIKFYRALRVVSFFEHIDPYEVNGFLALATNGTKVIKQGDEEFKKIVEALDHPLVFPGWELLCGEGYVENWTNGRAEGYGDDIHIVECIEGSVQFYRLLPILPVFACLTDFR